MCPLGLRRVRDRVLWGGAVSCCVFYGVVACGAGVWLFFVSG